MYQQYETDSWMRLADPIWQPIASEGVRTGWNLQGQFELLPLEMIKELNPEEKYDSRFAWFAGFLTAFVGKPTTLDLLSALYEEVENRPLTYNNKQLCH